MVWFSLFTGSEDHYISLEKKMGTRYLFKISQKNNLINMGAYSLDVKQYIKMLLKFDFLSENPSNYECH